MLRVGSWLYGKKPANASTQSLDSLAELKDCMLDPASADGTWRYHVVDGLCGRSPFFLDVPCADGEFFERESG
jgi:hypothetical protein